MREPALIVHLIGVVLWVGSTATGAFTAAQLAATATGETRTVGLGVVRRVLLVLGAPGLLLAWAGGLTMLIEGWSDLYARAGWMHGKLTIGLVLAALHGVVVGRVRRAATGQREASPALMTGLAMTIVVLALVNITLAIVRPG